MGFWVLFGHWPNRLRLFPDAIEGVRGLFTETSLRLLESRLQFVPDEDAAMVAEDESGHWYSYGSTATYSSEPLPDRRPRESAQDRLGVSPDAPHEGRE